MTDITKVGTWKLGDRTVKRIGYGAMQLTGPQMSGPPKDHAAALAVLRAAVEAGVDHIDTADFYGPHVTNELIREALAPYPSDLTVATKVGVLRRSDGSFDTSQQPETLVGEVHDNLRTLGVDILDVVNLRIIIGNGFKPEEGSIEARFTALAELQQQGLIRHLGLSNATAAQVEEAQRIAPVVCVQNQYNLVHRADDALIDVLAEQGIAYVPFFPLGGFSRIQSDKLTDEAARIGATPMQLALAWLLMRAPNILLIPGTSSVAHLRENLSVDELSLSESTMFELNQLVGS
ncbi:oxidoreductase [Pseudomonas aeruginosa]|uniref:oxidoreductase n=1 Tax=Pseudomonas aeruginosa TaxID=287 RepID=UPI001067C44A|nr:oxidoreductase [Pseudomonas aeruginosa]TEO19045.1 oxidoreductase [Pseudomonas aeruginosa]TEO21267.1 oxidoreductase [Pseudomonas aeruginosa]TEO25771.1 oxidoreductase [Pseudomonas aeruginosa]TEO42463.1 oxidoreductase [Pseudomonas aeruginosa]